MVSKDSERDSILAVCLETDFDQAIFVIRLSQFRLTAYIHYTYMHKVDSMEEILF